MLCKLMKPSFQHSHPSETDLVIRVLFNYICLLKKLKKYEIYFSSYLKRIHSAKGALLLVIWKKDIWVKKYRDMGYLRISYFILWILTKFMFEMSASCLIQEHFDHCIMVTIKKIIYVTPCRVKKNNYTTP